MSDDEMTARAQQRVGTILRGKYRIDRILGIGGMAVVYAATHRNQKQFAVKLLHPELSIQGDLRARFLREGYAANSVKHPGAVAVIDDDTAEDGAAFLVMELLEGASAEEIWEHGGGRLSLPASLLIAEQLLDVLAAAHAKGIVHRDIKPANLFVTAEGRVKVLDFGIARLRDGTGNSKATGTGLLLGTPAFMAPEQALGKTAEIDAQTDVWAAGSTLFTWLSGRSVHEGETASQVLIKAATAPAPPLASVAPDVPEPVTTLVDRALAFSKADRWPSAAAMRDATIRAQVAVLGRRVGGEVLTGLVASLGRAAAPVSTPAPWPTPASSSAAGVLAEPLPRADATGRRASAPLPQTVNDPHASYGARYSAPAITAGAMESSGAMQSGGAMQSSGATHPSGAGARGDLPPRPEGVPFGTTARPVLAEPSLRPAGVPSRRPMLFAAIFATAAVFAGGTVFALRTFSGAGDAPLASGAGVAATPSPSGAGAGASHPGPAEATAGSDPGSALGAASALDGRGAGTRPAGEQAAGEETKLAPLTPTVEAKPPVNETRPPGVQGRPSAVMPPPGHPATKPTTASPGTTLPAVATTPPAGRAAPPPAATSDVPAGCSPPFYFDNGVKKWKPDCLK